MQTSKLLLISWIAMFYVWNISLVIFSLIREKLAMGRFWALVTIPLGDNWFRFTSDIIIMAQDSMLPIFHIEKKSFLGTGAIILNFFFFKYQQLFN